MPGRLGNWRNCGKFASGGRVDASCRYVAQVASNLGYPMATRSKRAAVLEKGTGTLTKALGSLSPFRALLIAGHLAGGQFDFELIHQRPVGGASAPVGHVQVAFEPGDGRIEQCVVLAEDGPVAGQ